MGVLRASGLLVVFAGSLGAAHAGHHIHVKATAKAAKPPHEPRLPPMFEMALHIDHALRNESCEPCSASHPLGSMCCGLCGFWVNDKWKTGRANPWEGSCPREAMLRMLGRLQEEGLDLGSFQPRDLFEAIRGRTLWLLGDSQMERWYTAVECFLAPFLEAAPRAPPTNSTSTNLWLVNYDDQPQRMGTPWFPPKPAVCARYAGGTRVCLVRVHTAADLARPVLPALLHAVPGLQRDIAVLNAGLHYAIGAEEKYTRDLGALTAFIEEHRAGLPTLLWKDTSPQHFQYERGYYFWEDGSRGVTSGDRPSNSCRPLTPAELASEEMQAGGWYNRVAHPLMRAAHVPLLDTYQWTLPLWDLHMWHKDCTHFCYPSAYELWTYLLSEGLRHVELRP